MTGRFWIAAATAVALALPGVAHAAWFAKFDGVDGSSKKDVYKGWIELNAVTPAPTTQTPRGPGTLVINKPVDASSPKLKEAATTRKRFTSVRLDVTAPQGGSTVHYELKNVQITSYQLGATGAGAVAMEMITLAHEGLSLR